HLIERWAVAAEPTAPVGGALQVLITTSELVVGQNRFAFGLLQHNKLLDAATVAVRVYDIRDQQAQLMAETPALYHTLEVVEQGNRVHVHPDGTRHVHSETTDVQGIYVTPVTFARPGPWGLEILAQQGDGPVETARRLHQTRIADAIARRDADWEYRSRHPEGPDCRQLQASQQGA